jgi:hypothetical protein
MYKKYPVTFWAFLIRIHYLYGSESFSLLLKVLGGHKLFKKPLF